MARLQGIVLMVICFSMVMPANGWSQCEGDVDCNGVVDGSDLALLASSYGTTGCGSCDDVVNRIEQLESQVAQLVALLKGVYKSDDTIVFDGVNVQIVDGTGSTAGKAVNGLGNLIVGYDEDQGDRKTGSHNIVVGAHHTYSSYGGLVAGYNNSLSGPYAAVTGGRGNQAIGNYSSVSGGRNNQASGESSTVSGGGGTDSAEGNIAFADYSAVLGGRENVAGDQYLSDHSVGQQSVVSGGEQNLAYGQSSSISGGRNNTTRGSAASVSGGYECTAAGDESSVSGGKYSSVYGEYDWRAGDYFFNHP